MGASPDCYPDKSGPRLLVSLLFFICTLVPTVKAADTTNIYPHEDVLTLRFGGMWQQDQYLSPLLYDGMEVGISNEWWQACRLAPQGRHIARADRTGGWLTNPRYTNRLYALDIEAVSLVVHDNPDNSIAVGKPARVVKKI